MPKRKRRTDEIEAFIIDARLFRLSVESLEHYRDSLVLAYKELEQIEDLEEEILEDLNEQIEVMNVIVNNFRVAILKTIYGEGIETPEYH